MSRYQIADNIKYSKVYDRVILLDTRNGSYFELNAIAKIMLDELLNFKSVDQATDNLLEKIDGTRNEIKISFLDFRKELLSRGFIKEV